jgi:CBS domain containing-hemolysin-like protein
MDSTGGLIGFLILITLNAMLSAAFSSLINARKQVLRDMQEAGNRRAQDVLRLVEDEKRLRAACQFVGVLLHFLAASVVSLSIAQPFVLALIAGGMEHDSAEIVVYPAAWLISAVLTIMLGELIPTALVASEPERLAVAVVGPMRLLLTVLSPVSRLMLWVGGRMSLSFGANPPYVTEEEIKTLVDAGSEEGVIEDEEKEMIYSIFQFNDKVAREVMVPRIDIIALDKRATVEKALETIVAVGHSRIPVYEENIDRICGLLYAKDLLGLWRNEANKDRRVGEIMRPAYFVPESKRAGDLLEELQRRKVHMAIVIDEYGGTSGLVTIEDLLEEIVGEIQDEYDSDEEAEYQQISGDEYLFEAGISLDDVNELMNVHLSTEESDTLGGYVLNMLGKVPLVGESFQAEGLDITVESITGRRILRVRIKRLVTSLSEAAAEANAESTSPAEPDHEMPDMTKRTSDA